MFEVKVVWYLFWGLKTVRPTLKRKKQNKDRPSTILPDFRKKLADWATAARGAVTDFPSTAGTRRGKPGPRASGLAITPAPRERARERNHSARPRACRPKRLRCFFRCRIQCKLWFFHQSWSSLMGLPSYGSSKLRGQNGNTGSIIPKTAEA